MINMYSTEQQTQPKSLTTDQNICAEVQDYEFKKHHKRNCQGSRLDSTPWRKNIRHTLLMGDGNGNTKI